MLLSILDFVDHAELASWTEIHLQGNGSTLTVGKI